MKKLFLVLSLVCSGAFAGEFGTTVSNVSVVIAGPANTRGVTAYATGTVYSAGTKVRSNGITFVNLLAGTSGTTNPMGYVDFWDGGITWRPCLNSKRKGLIVQNAGAATVWLSLTGIDAQANRGLFLVANGSVGLTDNIDNIPQGEIRAISATGTTNVITTTEW